MKRGAAKFFGLCAIVVSLPLLAEAQEPKKIPQIGFIAMTSPVGGGQNLEAFRQGLRDLGYVEGANITIQPRWAGGGQNEYPISLMN
jgi:putative ABC transport system substrate-binding protein